MTNKNFKKMLLSLVAIMRGINEVLTAGKTMPFRNGTIDGPSLAAIVQPLLAVLQAVADNKTAWKASITARNNAADTISSLIDDIKKGASLAWKDTSVEFEQFGFAPKKKAAPLTPEAKQLKVERLRATRLARGTVGSRQRKAIKGVVPTPMTAPKAGPNNTTGK
ncbi:MAG TPA: hypothetical protein VFF73_41955 [Planctomycetota bacterium]|nr:hypothetical protein [Planctomycetota bacterium]